MAIKLRWMKFSPGDWRKDAALRLCSLAARGLWIELMCIAHDAEPYGHILVNGKPPTIKQIAALVGAGIDEVKPLLAELEQAAVFSRNESGIAYSRRMKNDREISEKQRAFGSNGGNPNLVKTKQTTENKRKKDLNGSLKARVKGGLKGSLKPESESESEKEEEKKDAIASSKKGFRLPADWEPDSEDRQYAADRGLDWWRTLEDFRGYWLAKSGKDATKLDWSLTWQGWCRREADRRGTVKQPKPPGSIPSWSL